MSEKHIKDKYMKQHRSKNDKYKKKLENSSGSDSDEWVEKELPKKSETQDRDCWMSMTGMLKTYTKDDIRPRRDKKDGEKQSIDSYNPGTSVRELNPYWKNGGSGIPQTSGNIRRSKSFMTPNSDKDLYSKSSMSYESRKSSNCDDYNPSSCHKSYREYRKSNDDDNYCSTSKSENRYKVPKDTDYYSSSKHSLDHEDIKRHNEKGYSKPQGNWRREKTVENHSSKDYSDKTLEQTEHKIESTKTVMKQNEGKYLSDEKMNKLAAKIVKAEIMGDTKVVNDLKTKLEAAREYRKQNPNAGQKEEDDGVMLISTNSMGNSRPLTKTSHGDPMSKGGKRKAETHQDGQRQKYFGNDDKYNLAQMFEQEKYGTNYDNDAQLAKISSKHKNPNDNLDDIFVDEISKNKNAAKVEHMEKEKAVKQHLKVERSLEGCEHCMDSKNMLKHLIVSCASRAYVALPARKSLVKGHCIITTIQHATCVTALDEDVWEEIMDYRKALTKFFNAQNKDVLFFETAVKLHKFPHLVINCVPLPRDVGDMASIYFNKALLECEAEWSMNKKVIDLKGKNIRKAVPKGLPYFWIDFAMDPGFAHVIEDQQLFPKTFAEEIIGGILDLDHNVWKNPQKEYRDQQRQKVLEFLSEWKEFDTVAKK